MRLPDPATTERQYQQLESHLADWANARPDIRAVVIIGSRARTDHPADGWSDLDAILFVDNTSVFRQAGAWQRDLEGTLGLPVWFAALDMLTDDSPEWELVMEGGYKADLSFFPNHAPDGPRASLGAMIAHAPFHNVFARGMRPLVDKGSPGLPLELTLRVDPLPDQPAFDNLIANILLELTRAAKMARRGELWRAARTMDQELQENFLKLLEFHAKAGGAKNSGEGAKNSGEGAKNSGEGAGNSGGGAGKSGGGAGKSGGGAGKSGGGKNTWAYGRFLEEWSDRRAVRALPGTFARSEWPSVRDAILASLDLLGWLGPETAERLKLAYPRQAVEKTAAWLREMTER